ncbi:MAG: zf-TFIIB domain-containing protein [Pyrinomonadaceae bacterium]
MPIDLEDRGQALENEYFHRKEQELIARMKAKLEQQDTKSLEIQCPKCDGTLIETDFEQITIDICDKCSGVWLDPGELTLITDKEEDSGWFGKIFG